MGVGRYSGRGHGGFSHTTARLIRKRGKSPTRARRIVAKGRARGRERGRR